MSKSLKIFTWATLVFIYLVVIAGSVVRSTGSGMGCPDWPKCFNQVIPPTDISQLPSNYKEIYVNKRRNKVEKFSKVLIALGMRTTAEELINDDSLWKEEDFNWKKTWTEYANRLVGALAGLFVFFQLLWLLIKHLKNKLLVFLAFSNLILMGFEGWLGSIVVATNLVPWVLTLHMLFALIIIFVQIKIIHLIEVKKESTSLPLTTKLIYNTTIFITTIQILIGAQVRQAIDFLVSDNVDRGEWIGNMETDFYFHRSLIWIIILVNGYLYWKIKDNKGLKIIQILVLSLIGIEFITGICFSYAGMPAALQPVHLLTATLMIGIQIYGHKRISLS